MAVTSGSRSRLTDSSPAVKSDARWSRRSRSRSVESFWDGLGAGVAGLEPVTLADLGVGFGIGRDFPDQDFSLSDRTSFAVMGRLGLHRAVAFDEGFAIYRFGPGRRLAFTVLR